HPPAHFAPNVQPRTRGTLEAAAPVHNLPPARSNPDSMSSASGCAAARAARLLLPGAAGAAAAASAAGNARWAGYLWPPHGVASASAALRPWRPRLSAPAAFLHSGAGDGLGKKPDSVKRLKRYRSTSVRERLGMPPIVREDPKKKSRPVISIYEAEWNNPGTLAAEVDIPPAADEAHAAAEAVAAQIAIPEEAAKEANASAASSAAATTTGSEGEQ
ncbi:MAG: hypothetical protein BJ554DRAFT_6307, partial [Olpidium bornovanus]